MAGPVGGHSKVPTHRRRKWIAAVSPKCVVEQMHSGVPLDGGREHLRARLPVGEHALHPQLDALRLLQRQQCVGAPAARGSGSPACVLTRRAPCRSSSVAKNRRGAPGSPLRGRLPRRWASAARRPPQRHVLAGCTRARRRRTRGGGAFMDRARTRRSAPGFVLAAPRRHFNPPAPASMHGEFDTERCPTPRRASSCRRT